MAIVSCPDCSKKLKVADTSVGKKVKCSCGNVFVAQASLSPAGKGVGGTAAPAKAAAPDKVLVACTECGAKLKVATASLGKKMKCPKCASVFVANSDEEIAAPPPKKAPPRPPLADEDDAPKPKAKAKAKAVSDDDMDDLFSFAEKDAAKESGNGDSFQDDDDDFKPKAKVKPVKKADPDEEDEDDAPRWKSKKQADLDEEDDEPMPKSKFGKKPAKPSKSDDDEDEADQKPVYPRRTFLNIVVFLLLIGFVTFFALVFIGGILPDLGLPKPKDRLAQGRKIIVVQESEEDKKKKEDAAAAENKKEAAKLEGTWFVDSAEAEGKPYDEIPKGEKVTITAGVVNGLQLDDAKIVIDASKDPKWIDFAGDKKVTIVGIYKIDNDSLQLSTGKPRLTVLGKEQAMESGPRPTQFDSKAGFLFVLKREVKVKEKEKDKEKEKAKEKDTDTKAAANLDGAWVIESAIAAGKSDDRSKGEVMTFADGKVTGMGPTPVPFTVNVTKEPHWIDVTIPIGKDKTAILAGIFKLEDGKLYLCVPGEKNLADRPKDFEGKNSFVAVLRRASKDDSKYSRIKSMNNLKQIALALHNYHSTYMQLPPAASSGKDDATAKPLLSWRVAILPYIDELPLFQQFDLDKPWDDPHNMKLIAKMPKVYMIPGVDAKEGMTHYRTLVGPGTVLEPKKGPGGKLVGRKLIAIPDGTVNVFMVVEAKDPTIWTKPDDLPYDPKGPLPKFGVVPAGFNAAFADGSVRFVPAGVPEKVLRPYLTCDNGMPREPLAGKDDKGPDKELDQQKDKEKDKDDGKYSRNKSANHLKQIGLAVHTYHDQNKRLPAAGISGANDPTGKPLLSWRVAILPYIDEQPLYLQFDLDKPWDDPHNMKLIAKMPKVYLIPGVSAKGGMTHYRTLVGRGTPLGQIKGGIRYTLANIPDGTSNTIMVVEATEPTIWTKPDDLPYDPKGSLPKFGVDPAGFNALFADASVRFIPAGVSEKALRPYLTCDNGIPRAPLDGKEDKGGEDFKEKDKEQGVEKGNDRQTARERWQDDFAQFINEWDKVGAALQATVKKHSKNFEAKPVAWKLKFVGFRKNALGTSIEFDLDSFGIIEPKKAAGLNDPKWKRPVIMDFKPSADALPAWEKVEPGTIVTCEGTFDRAFWVQLNGLRDFAIVNVKDVALAGSQNLKTKDADTAPVQPQLADFAGTWKTPLMFLKGKGQLIQNLEMTIEPDGKANASYRVNNGDQFQITSTGFRVTQSIHKDKKTAKETTLFMIPNLMGVQWLVGLQKADLKLTAIIATEKGPSVESFLLTKVVK